MKLVAIFSVIFLFRWTAAYPYACDDEAAMKAARRETACNGLPFRLKCQSATPIVSTIKWTKMPDVCIQKNDHFNLNQDEFSLEVNEVTEDDVGYYMCSHLGFSVEEKSYLYLDVRQCFTFEETETVYRRDIAIFEDPRCVICPDQGPASKIEFTQTPPPTQTVRKGAIVPLYCSVNTYDDVEITWWKDNKPITDERPTRSWRTGLIIYNFNSMHAGTYKCVVKHAGCTIEAQATVLMDSRDNCGDSGSPY